MFDRYLYSAFPTSWILSSSNISKNPDSASPGLSISGVVTRILPGSSGRYIFSKAAQITEDGRLLTSVGMEGSRDERGNFRVDGVFKGAPADTAGISAGDLIVQINGKLVRNMSDSELAAVLSGFNSLIISPS